MGTKNYHYNRSSYYKQNKEELTSEEWKEIYELVRFFRKKGYRKSFQISNYIKTHNLGYRYPNITGHLTMTNEHDIWDFDGGIGPKYYAIICEKLGIDSKHTRSWDIGFESYQELGC